MASIVAFVPDRDDIRRVLSVVNVNEPLQERFLTLVTARIAPKHGGDIGTCSHNSVLVVNSGTYD